MQYSSSLFEFEGASSMVAKLFKRRKAVKPTTEPIILTAKEAEILRLVLDDYILTREQRPIFSGVKMKLLPRR
jgi:predicted DNA-binding protein (UPF0251 family)